MTFNFKFNIFKSIMKISSLQTYLLLKLQDLLGTH